MRLLPDAATPADHLDLARLLVKGGVVVFLGVLGFGALAVLVVLLPGTPSPALTALLGGVAGTLGSALVGLATSLAQDMSRKEPSQ